MRGRIVSTRLSRVDEKRKQEQDDLRLVLGTIYQDPDLLERTKAPTKYLMPKKPYRIIDSVGTRDVTIRKVQTGEPFTVRLKAGGQVFVGGGGIVLQCANKTQPNIEYALKIARPSLYGGEPAEIARNYNATLEEIVKHAPLSHENVVRVLNWGQFTIGEGKPQSLNLNTILMEWIEGARPLSKWLVEKKAGYGEIVTLLTECFEALGYIHARGLIHWEMFEVRKEEKKPADPLLHPETSDRLKTSILHSIIDSAIDADKLDYLLRDAHHSGVHYAQGIDADRFFQSLTTICVRHSDGSASATIGVTERGLLPVESMLIARYQMFSCVYWHHTTRALTAMLQFLVLSYLSVVASPQILEQRLERLISHFRELDDEAALKWLKTELANEAQLPEGRKRFLQEMADALLGEARDFLYWTAFELPYEPESGEGSRKTAGKNIYEQLTRLSEGASNTGTPGAYVEYSNKIRRDFTRDLSAVLKGEFHKPVGFDDGEVLIDIPPKGKDQVENVFVWTGISHRPIQELSPMADAVRGAFRYWVRRPRVFLGPKAWKKCENAKLTAEEVEQACVAALKKMVVAQLDLPLPRKPGAKKPAA